MAERRQEISDTRLWSLVESAPDGMVLADELGVILMVNHQVESMFGYPRAELVGRQIEELLPERYQQAHTAHRTRYRVDPQVRSMGAGLDLWARRRDGTEFPVEISLSPVADSDGAAVIASVRDVSERRAADAHAQQVQAAIDATHDGVFMFAADTLRFSYVNQGAIDQTGYRRDELLAMTPLHIAPEFTGDAFREVLAPLVAGEVPRLTFRTVHRTRAGHDLPVEIVLDYPQASGPAAPRVLVALVRDIGERLAAERQLADSEQAFRTAFDDAPVGMMMAHIEPGGARIVDRANVALCALLGRPEADLVGIDLASLTHPDDLAADVVAASEMLEGDRARYVIEKRYLRTDGRYAWVLLNSTVLSRDGGVRLLAHVLDISDRRAAEAERDRQQRWLQGLSDIRTHLLEDQPVEEALALVCRHAQELSAAAWAAIAYVAVDGQSLDVVTACGKHPAEGSLPLRVPADLLIKLAADTAFAMADHRWTADFSGPSLVMPLVTADEAEASFLLLVRPDGPPFDEIEIRLVESFARQANAAFQRVRARRDQQRLFVLEDRERIARDLHDIVIQRMFAAGLGLEALVERVSPASAALKLRSTVDELDLAIRDLRSAIFGLSALDAPRSIADQIANTVTACSDRLGFAVALTLPEHVEAVPLAVVEQMIPALNEALSNVVRHANASMVEVVVELAEHEVVFEVRDDGDGLGEDLVHGSGLGNLVGRASRLGGDCTIENNLDGGVTVRWWAPV